VSSILAELSTEEIEKLPKGTIVKLSCPAGEGERRSQIKRILGPMAGNGFSADRMFEILRPMYDTSFGNGELRSLIKWYVQHKDRFTPNGQFSSESGQSPATKRDLSKEERIENAERFLNGFLWTPDQLAAASKIPIYGEPRDVACLYVATKYRLTDLLNVVLDFKLNKEGKPSPYGPGVTRSVFQWRRSISEHGVPHSDAGCKYRINPVRPVLGKDGYAAWHGSGYGGSYTDGDIDRVIYVMGESDILSLDMQTSVLAKLPLRISSVTDTGGRGLHAGIALLGGAEEGRAILQRLYTLGFDRDNGSPSRLERMPGDIRILGARDEGGTEQRLLYLDPEPSGGPIHD
jgi:hypothetical protein